MSSTVCKNRTSKRTSNNNVRTSKKGVKFGLHRISNCEKLVFNDITYFLNTLNQDLLKWGEFLHTSTDESIDKREYYTYFYNIRGTAEFIREILAKGITPEIQKTPEKLQQFKVDKYFDTYIDPKIYSMPTTELKSKITELVTIHKKIWIFLIKIDRCEVNHTKKSPNKDVCFRNQKIFFPPPIIENPFSQKEFFYDTKKFRNYLVNPDAAKIKSVFYKGDGQDGKMYKKRGVLNADYYEYNNDYHKFSEKSDNRYSLNYDYHTICINDKGLAEPILKLFNGISTLLCFMFIFLDKEKAKEDIRNSYHNKSTSVIGSALTGIAMTLV
jgi:hypothetical protein